MNPSKYLFILVVRYFYQPETIGSFLLVNLFFKVFNSKYCEVAVSLCMILTVYFNREMLGFFTINQLTEGQHDHKRPQESRNYIL